MNRKKNNKGFSLVELIAIVAIIAILAGLTTASLNLIGRTRAKATAQSIDRMLSRCKAENLSGLDCYVLLSDDAVMLYAEADKSAPLETVEYETNVSVQPESVLNQPIGFDMQTGALNGTEDLNISVKSGLTEFVVTVTALTGNHSIQ